MFHSRLTHAYITLLMQPFGQVVANKLRVNLVSQYQAKAVERSALLEYVPYILSVKVVSVSLQEWGHFISLPAHLQVGGAHSSLAKVVGMK